MRLTAKGTVLSNLLFGQNAIIDWLTPYKVTLDTDQMILTISKRNDYLIGVDKITIPVRNVRNVTYDAHLFGGDLHFKVYGTRVQSAYCLRKASAKRIRDYLVSQMSNKKGLNLN